MSVSLFLYSAAASHDGQGNVTSDPTTAGLIPAQRSPAATATARRIC
jgi:hypothetical protein